MNRILRKLWMMPSVWLSSLFFLTVFLVSMAIVGDMTKTAKEQEWELSGYVADSFVGKVQYVISSQLFTANIVEALIQDNDGVVQDFAQMMAGIIKELPIKCIAIAPDGIISQVYPLETNENLIGFHMLEQGTHKGDTITAKNTKTMTLSGPYEMKSGEYGLIGRQPVYLKNKDGEEYFWGFVCVAMNFPEALDSAQLIILEKRNLAYELWRIDPDNQKKQILAKSVKHLADVSVDRSFLISNASWTLSLAPEEGWLNKIEFSTRIAFALGIDFLLALLFKSAVDLLRRSAELNLSLSQQAHHYEKLYQIQDEWRVLRHDLNNHFICFRHMLDNKDIQAALDYLDVLYSKSSHTAKLFSTGNYVFDALLADKVENGKRKNIIIECQINISRVLNIELTDWCILFGNALDNAIEACEQAPDGARFIQISVQNKGNMLQAEIKNTYSMELTQRGPYYLTTKVNKSNHGIGMHQMQRVVKKYQGVMETTVSNHEFSLSVLLCNV